MNSSLFIEQQYISSIIGINVKQTEINNTDLFHLKPVAISASSASLSRT
jgi:hypothetical protein